MRRSGALVASLVVLGLTTRCGGPNREPEGFFAIQCQFSHALRDDPILFPGRRGASRLNSFFGNGSTNALSTPNALARHRATTCASPYDRAAYWSPAMFRDGRLLRVPYQNEYWLDGGFARVRSVPFGMELTAGNAHATADQSTDVVYYFCGGTHGPAPSPHRPRPYDCALYVERGDPSGVIAVIVFPQCWDGTLSRGTDTAHLAYPVSAGMCPPGFPIALPRLEEHVHLGIVNPLNPDGSVAVSLSSGPYYTLAGAFLNAWVPSGLADFVEDCTDAHITCPINVEPPG